MSKVTYFQRYSTRENAVTNSTLHLFSQIYQESTDRLKELFCELLGNEISLGVEFVQQERCNNAVPDGYIYQQELHIKIETKVTAGVDVNQLIRHCETFKSSDCQKFLILLTRNEVNDRDLDKVKIEAKNRGIVLCKCTFEELCSKLKNYSKEHETHLKNIIEDYISYCNESDLFVDRRKWLSIVPCGSTFELNKTFNMYYQPSDRGYSPQDYLGIYNNKSVKLIGKITAVFDSVIGSSGELELSPVIVSTNNSYTNLVYKMIEETNKKLGWGIRDGHRFYCVDQFYETNFKKTTPRGIMGGRYFDVTDVSKESQDDTEKLALILRGKTWG